MRWKSNFSKSRIGSNQFNLFTATMHLEDLLDVYNLIVILQLIAIQLGKLQMKISIKKVNIAHFILLSVMIEQSSDIDRSITLYILLCYIVPQSTIDKHDMKTRHQRE